MQAIKTERNDLSPAWTDFAGAAQSLVARVTSHVARLVGDVERDARTVARDSHALVGAVVARAAELASTARATPRLARLSAEGLRIFALHRLAAARIAAPGAAGPRAPGARAAGTARRVPGPCLEPRGGVLKPGQLVAGRVDLLPAAAIAELVQLQDRVPALPDEIIRAHVEAELGRPLAEVFASFGPALAAASLA